MMEREGIVMCSFEDEDLRLEELYQLDILHTPPEETFDRITQMMSSIFKTPIALVSLVTKDAQWFKSSYGLPEDLQNGTEREVSFCQHVVAMKKSLVVEDATKDERFKRNRLVTRQEGIRFYAATPLVTKNNNVLGTVCIIDTKPRSITVVDMKILRGFADSTIQLIEDREMLNLLKSRSIFLIEKNK